MCPSPEMRLVSRSSEALECSGGAAAGKYVGGGAVVVVGVKLDSRSKELLTWALVKAARPGDRVIALHIINPDADKTCLLSLVKSFDLVLAAYEGFCNLKQVDLKLKVCKGSSVRKVLSREVTSCGATCLVVGTSEVYRTFRSKISLARSCAKSLLINASVICVDNGKILFQRESTGPLHDLRRPDASVSRCKNRNIGSRSPLSLPPQRVSLSSSSASENSSVSCIGSGSISTALVPCKTQEMALSRSRWVRLCRKILQQSRGSEDSTTKKSSVLQWLLKLPSSKSVSAIYPNQKHLTSNKDDYCSLLPEEKDSIILYSDDTKFDVHSNRNFSEELKDIQEKYSTKCEFFSYQELSLATDNFISENLIGKGGSSKVYRGCLPGGREIAVKVLKSSKDALEHFVSEIEILTTLHHKNIISLIGFCCDENRLLLVYNFLSRGCLEENLHGIYMFIFNFLTVIISQAVNSTCYAIYMLGLGNLVSGNLFGWEERHKIALGVAEALDSLHSTAETIIHRDVKSSNILLSQDFEPQLSDFGLATWSSSCSRDMDTSDVAGTFGYLAPEYFMHGKLNEKIDVYAFGVVLLELLSGRKPIDNGLPEGQESLVMWANCILKQGKISELRDPSLGDAYDKNQLENVVLAATVCIRHTPQLRPKISLVLKLLQGDSEAVEWARQVANCAEDTNATNGEQSATDIQSFINLALLDLEDETASTGSIEQNVAVEDYLGSRWSPSSFD